MPIRRNPNAPYWIQLAAAERRIIEGALTATGGNVTRAAGALGIDRTHLTKRIQALEIDRQAFKPGAGEVAT